MRKSVFAKRVLTVVLAATMMLSNNVAALADALPDVSANQTEVITDIQGGEEESADSNIASEETQTSVTTDNATESANTVTQSSESDEVIAVLPPEMETVRIDASKLPDNDTLLEGFLEKELKEQIAENNAESTAKSGSRRALMRAIPRSQAMNLSGNDLAVYNWLKVAISEVANGTRNRTDFVIPVSVLNNGKTSYTSEELGGADLSTSPGQAIFWNKFKFNLDVVIDALLADCPYDFYWFDKTAKCSSSLFSASVSTGRMWLPDNASFMVNLPVSADYSTSGYTDTFAVDTDKTIAASSAVANATAVVNSASGTDYDKLVYYRDWLRDELSYDHVAARTVPAYGDPWQVIRVFDNDPGNNTVVCEGYSKAFKWLCDLSNFSDSKTGCHLVSGDLGQNGNNPGGHMWNIMCMDDGKYYLVDITNYDGDVELVEPPYIGYDSPELFLNGYSDKLSANKYKVDLKYGNYLTYEYDTYALGQFSEDELAISKDAYVQSRLFTVTFDANGHG